MSADARRRRLASNEARFRDINERLEEGLRQVRHMPDLLEFVCECGDRDCAALVELSLDEYEAVRRDSRRFAAVPGHVFADIEDVVFGSDRYEVVEKFGDALEVTNAADQRFPGTSARRSRSPRRWSA